MKFIGILYAIGMPIIVIMTFVQGFQFALRAGVQICSAGAGIWAGGTIQGMAQLFGCYKYYKWWKNDEDKERKQLPIVHIVGMIAAILAAIVYFTFGYYKGVGIDGKPGVEGL